MVFIMCNAAESFVFTLTLGENWALFGSISSFYCKAWLLKYVSSLLGYFFAFLFQVPGVFCPIRRSLEPLGAIYCLYECVFSFLPHLKMIRFYAVASEECRRVLVAMFRSAIRM